MDNPVRLRVEFHDGRHVLTKSQRSEGFRRCWILLRPELSTVADLAAHLIHAFALQHSCPHGLLLEMEDFVIPPFESTSIFKDKDIVRARKKVIKKKLREICGDAYHIQNSEILEKQPIHFGNNFTIKGFQEALEASKSENEVNECEAEENTSIRQTLLCEEPNLKRKRKQLSKSENSKRKKTKHINSEKTIIIANKEDNILDQTHSLSDGDDKSENLMNSQNEVPKKNFFVNREERHDRAVDCDEVPSKPHINGDKKKRSRSAKRKKAKREWRRELSEKQAEKIQCEALQDDVDSTSKSHDEDQVIERDEDGEDDNMQSNGTVDSSRNAHCKKAKRQGLQKLANQEVKDQVLANDTQSTSSEEQVVDQTADIEEDIVPVIVRPGHIRFEPLDEEHTNMQSNGPVGTLQWNGTTSKKKGQKWGREKSTSWSYEDNSCNGVFHGKLITGEEKHVNDHIDFESLFPLTRLPEEGDMLVYRVVELSSSWCPELSDFRVGKVSSYDPVSTKIVLLPVPEYPIVSNEKDAEETAEQPNSTLYKEDGSLEVEYTSLLDLRLLKAHDSDDLQNAKSNEAAQSDNWELMPSVTNSKQSAIPPSELGSSMGWEQIKQALHEKKAQLQNKTTTTTTTTTSWSYRALRRSAMGPTLALLRRDNGNAGDANSSDKHASGKHSGSK
ncbi:hypothetical protein Cni_G20084 [Canna indica]|uniref:Coilin n=1 Tax=Canna indica TaxID=4628 RepID=A0AAQ3KLT6_9LILI|nr:hypothetical protein Cni_G20084 [Canna indica]